MSNARKILVRAKNLIKKGGWTKHVYSRDIRGREIDRYSDRAACFCLVGSIDRAKHDLNASDIDHSIAYKALSGMLEYDIVRFNDSQCKTKAEAMRMLDKAAKEVEE